MNDSVLVLFTEDLPNKSQRWWKKFDVVVGPSKVKKNLPTKANFVDIGSLVDPGNIYEASLFVEELPNLKSSDGSSLVKSFTYKGYELWWMHYNELFIYFCLPYTQYKRLLGFLRTFGKVSFISPPYKSLFFYYLLSSGSEVSIVSKKRIKNITLVPFGILLQIIATFFSIPILMVKKCNIMVFIGDKFEKSKDYDFRMKFIYRELRQRNLVFVEFIRSLESWRTVLQHIFVRKRPVIYSEAISFMGRLISFLSLGRYRAKKKFGYGNILLEQNPQKRFMLLITNHYFLDVYADIWTIRIMRLILYIIGVKAGYITAALDRTFHTVIGCKLNRIQTVGILHGVASRHYNGYDFLPAFNGKKMLSVDKYGLWSEWWKDYYLKNSRAYNEDQLYVSGLMRPILRKDDNISSTEPGKKGQILKVLFVPGELSPPKEVLCYLLSLIESKDISVYITFRPYRDAFEKWLKKNNPEIIEKLGRERILLGDIHNAISECDICVGSYSTAALEALLQSKPVIFFKTSKWGDYFNLKGYDDKFKFYTESPEELIESIRKSRKIPKKVIQNLQERFFGDPYKNGSLWVVNQLENIVLGKGEIKS